MTSTSLKKYQNFDQSQVLCRALRVSKRKKKIKKGQKMEVLFSASKAFLFTIISWALMIMMKLELKIDEKGSLTEVNRKRDISGIVQTQANHGRLNQRLGFPLVSFL